MIDINLTFYIKSTCSEEWELNINILFIYTVMFSHENYNWNILQSFWNQSFWIKKNGMPATQQEHNLIKYIDILD
jgi:hypothetical protein